jgi:hypothetical protein
LQDARATLPGLLIMLVNVCNMHEHIPAYFFSI